MTEPFDNAQDLLAFMLAGKAIFSVRSLTTGNHFTYRVKPPRGDSTGDVFFVELRGSDSIFRYMGNIVVQDQRFILTRRTPAYMKDHPATVGFSYLYRWLVERSAIPDQVEVYHEGKCSACGIALTHPESIRRGIGPECRKKKGRRG